MTKTMEEPHWEHGWRCHGYWIGNHRIGYVGLTPPGFPAVYTWSLDWPKDAIAKGESKTLRRAKRFVEKHYASQCAVTGRHATANADYQAS